LKTDYSETKKLEKEINILEQEQTQFQKQKTEYEGSQFKVIQNKITSIKNNMFKSYDSINNAFKLLHELQL
jgi:hypothetical protein